MSTTSMLNTNFSPSIDLTAKTAEEGLTKVLFLQSTDFSENPNSSCLRRSLSWIKNCGSNVKKWAKGLKKETSALYYAYKDPRCPTLAKVVAIATVAYAVSPIDLIPDFIPVIGYLDDAIIVPAGLLLAKKLIPAEVMEDARRQVQEGEKLPKSKAAAAAIIGIWTASAAYGAYKTCAWLGYL